MDTEDNLSVIHANYSDALIRGGERQLILLVENLARLGVRQAVLCRRDSPLYEAVAQINGVRLLRARDPFLDSVAPHRAHIFHAHEARSAYWAGIRAGVTRAPYIITRRVLNPISTSIFTGAIYRRASAIVGVSNAVCRQSEDETGRESVCIYDAHQNLTPDPKEVAHLRQEIRGEPIIGQIAALVDARKGQSATITAFAAIKSVFPKACLVLVGSGPDEARLKEFASNTPDVIFAGYRKDVANWTAALDLLIYPSARDALASSLLDAMRLGVAVVANRVGGIPEIARHEETALTVEPNDETGLAREAIRLLSEEHLRQRLVNTARTFAEMFSPDVMGHRYLELYRDVLRTGRTSTRIN